MIRIVFLGTTAAVPTRERNLSSIFLQFNEERLLFDCGEGTQRQLMIKNLKFMRISKIFISHWHADHFGGLLGLVQTMSLENRKEPLYIYGPRRTAEFVDRLLEVGYFARNFEVVAEDVDEGDVVKGDGYKVIPFRVKHRIPALGFVFQEDDRVRANMEKAAQFGLTTSPIIGKLKAGQTVTFKGRAIKPEDVIEIRPGKKVVYSGDTAFTENIIKFSQNADLLIHDCTFTDEFEEKAGDYRHGTPSKAGEAAAKANAKRLVLTHISRRYQSKEDQQRIVTEAKKAFKETSLAEDFMEIIIK